MQKFALNSNRPKSQHCSKLSLSKEHLDEPEAIKSSLLKPGILCISYHCSHVLENTHSQEHKALASIIDLCAASRAVLFSSFKFSCISLFNYFQKTSNCVIIGTETQHLSMNKHLSHFLLAPNILYYFLFYLCLQKPPNNPQT